MPASPESSGIPSCDLMTDFIYYTQLLEANAMPEPSTIACSRCLIPQTYQATSSDAATQCKYTTPTVLLPAIKNHQRFGNQADSSTTVAAVDGGGDQNATGGPTNHESNVPPMQNIPGAANSDSSINTSKTAEVVDLEKVFSISPETKQNQRALICRFCAAKIMSENVAVHFRQSSPGTFLPGFFKKKQQPIEEEAVQHQQSEGVQNQSTSHIVGEDHSRSACYTQFWLVNDIFAFDNVGFSHAVAAFTNSGGASQQPAAEDEGQVAIQRRYLICAECEMGPIGYRDENKQEEIFVACDRVKYND